MATSPVLDQIDTTSDPDWIICHNVPILDEHSLFVPEDKEKGTPDRQVNIDRGFLLKLAANNNRLVTDTGDMIPLTEGHTKDNAPESEQPEILGWADNFSVGPLFGTGRHALLARFRISKKPDKLKKASNLPRRSVELWLDRGEVNPISLLGATAPERNLGLLRLSRMAHILTGRDGKTRYSLARVPIRFNYASPAMQPSPTPSPMPMPAPNPIENPAQPQAPSPGTVDPAMVQAVVQALMQTDVWQKLSAMAVQPQPQVGNPADPASALMGGGMGGMLGGAGGQLGMGGGDPMLALMAMLGGAGGGMGGGDDKDDKTRDGDKVNMQAGTPGTSLPGTGGYPGSTGVSVPRLTPMSNQTPNPRSLNMSRVQDYARSGETPEQTIIRLGQERDHAIRLSRENQVRVELHALSGEIILDPAEELPRLVEMSDEQRAAEYGRMRVRYQRRGQQQHPVRPNLPQLPGGTVLPEPEEIQNPVVGQNTPDRRVPASGRLGRADDAGRDGDGSRVDRPGRVPGGDRHGRHPAAHPQWHLCPQGRCRA